MSTLTGLTFDADPTRGHVRASHPSPHELKQIPGVLRHLVRLSAYLHTMKEPTAYIAVYAQRPGQRHGEHVDELAPPLEALAAQDSGFEGIACVDDAARAVILALRVYELTAADVARRLAEDWLRFVICMQRRSDNRMLNFILDSHGARNEHGQTSYPGGVPWTSRALGAYAAAWRVLRHRDALRRFWRTPLPITNELHYVAEYTSAAMDVFETRPEDHGLRTSIEAMCQLMIANGITHGPGYFQATIGENEVPMYASRQLAAVARAGLLFGHHDYIEACERTVANLVEPVIKAGFYRSYPTDRGPQCVYDIVSIAEGLEALYLATRSARYRELALECCAWLEGSNPAGAPLYDPETGRCHDKVSADGVIEPGTGAESAIEAGNLHLVRCRLTGVRAGLSIEDKSEAA